MGALPGVQTHKHAYVHCNACKSRGRIRCEAKYGQGIRADE